MPEAHSAASSHAYAPRMRTALVLVGSGTAGAYHAGVLRALQEAGVKIDLVAGHGVGVVGALFAAADGGERLWEAGGFWRQRRTLARWYRWRPGLRRFGVAVAGALALVLAPVGVLGLGLLVFPIAFLLSLAGLSHGPALAAAYTEIATRAFDPAWLPGVLPKALVAALAALAVVVSVTLAGVLAPRRGRRTDRTPLYWRLVHAPLGTDEARQHVERTMWRLVGGAAGRRTPTGTEFCRAYTELLLDNLGQPGFRELIVAVHDLDARGDLVAGLLAERYRQGYFGRRPGEAADRRPAEAIDLAGVGRDHLLDLLRASLVLPVATPPHELRFAPESYWRGEVHRVADRPGALARLLEEVAAAGAEQVVVVSATPARSRPHALEVLGGDLRQRVGEYLAGLDAASSRDAGLLARAFKGHFVIRPAHNPIGPLDLGGRFDPLSDRFQPLEELIDRGYEDAYRQFIDPVVASGADAPGQTADPREGTR